MKIANKTINYSIYTFSNGKNTNVGDTTEVTLPSVEIMTDSIKGAGISGEIDMPSYYQTGSLSTTISIRATNEESFKLIGATDIEVRWVTDQADTSNVSTKVLVHKAFMKVKLKKFEEGKVAVGESMDGSYEYEVFAYKRITNGKEVLSIDKFNNIFAVNGINLLKDLNSAL